MKPLLLLGLCFSIPLFASRQIVPVAGHLPGAAGTFWSTDVSLTNASTTSQTVQLVFHPAPGVSASRTLLLAAGESRLLEDAVRPEDFGAQTSTWFGMLEVISSGDIKVSSRTFSGDPSAGGTFGSSYDAVDPDILPSRGVITGLLSNSTFRTNIAFTNATLQGETFRFDIRDDSGAIRASDGVTVASMTTVQISIAPYVSGITSPLSLSWSADDHGFALASVIDNKSGDPTGISSVAIGSNRLFFPIVASAPGSQNTFWTTSVAVTSDSDSAGDLTLHFSGNDGALIERHVSLAPHGSFRTDDLFQFLGLNSGSGFLTIDSTVPAVGSARVFNTTEDRGTFGSSIAAQGRVVSATSLRIDGLRRDSMFRLNVGLANEDRIGGANGTIRLFDDRHNLVESQPFSLGPSTSSQFSISRSQIEVHGGEIEVEVENGMPVTGIASNVDNSSGDSNVVEVEQENERQQEAEISISPKTAAAGIPVTMTANLRAFSGATFTWNFGDHLTATGSTVTHTFVNPGEYIITVTATLPGGATVREVEDITILGANGTNLNSSFNFTWTPTQPQPGQAVTFMASGGTGTANWEFPGNIRRTGNSVTFTFASNGSFEVEAEIEHEGTPTVRVVHIVTVGSGGGTNPGGAATAINVNVSPSTPMHGQAATLSATFDQPPASGSVVKWRFPDGSRPNGNPVTFTFASSGTFQVEAELEQPGRATIQKTIFVSVQ